MTKSSSLALFAILSVAACRVHAPTPVDLKILLENDQVRVVEYSIKPGEDPPKISYPVGGNRIVSFEIKKVDDPAVPPAEDRALLDPAGVTVKLDNDSIRMMEVIIPVDFKEKVHTHPAYVTYVLDGGQIRIHANGEAARDSELKPGATFFSERVTHWAENTGTSAIRVLLVEIRHKQ